MHWTLGVTILSIIGTIANAKKKHWCFYIWLVTNITWALYDWYIGAHWQSIQNAIYAVISVYGIYEWKKVRNVC